MTPKQYLMKEALLLDAMWEDKPVDQETITAKNIDDLYEELVDLDHHWDAENEIRGGFTERTGLDTPFSRHYEAEAVAMKTADGTWVGWTYWFGGGKHGEPSSIPWMDDAYFLDVTTEEKMVEVHTFKKKEDVND